MKTLLFAVLIVCTGARVFADNAAEMAFLAGEVARLEKQSVNDFVDPAKREERRAQALEMFGLSPMPARGDLHAVVTGRLEDEFIAVEKLHFQSSPQLYVTANFYLPKKIEKPLPTVIYVCGHALVATNGVSYGNKTAYGHHGAWFARNGYACLVIDTVELGEIRGTHHGTYSEGMWWWNSRGYSPAGVEAWNTIRAIDYLETRPEVDKTRIGITGRSGGGAYSWSASALDTRIKIVAPVAGITDLRNHVIDGAVEGHCDCMFFVNTYGWDYPMLAACVAPRPLLIVNSDKDSIFPLDGVVRLNAKVSEFYTKLGKRADEGLVIGPGPHKDTQDLQMPVFRWFNKYLRGYESLVDIPATNSFTPQQLRVFDKLPENQRNTTVHEWFIPKAEPGPKIENAEQWRSQREKWMNGLKQKVFRNWPDLDLRGHVFREEARSNSVEIISSKKQVSFSPRELSGDAKTITQMRRRYMLIGDTVDSLRVHDIVGAAESEDDVTLKADGNMAMNALFASLFSTKIKSLVLKNLPATIEKGPDYLNVLRVLDIREALAMALEHCDITLINPGDADIRYAREIAKALGWKHRLETTVD